MSTMWKWVGGVSAALVIGFLWFLFHTMWNTATHGFFRFLAGSQLFWVGLVLTIALGALGWYLNESGEDRWGFVTWVAAAVVFLGVLIGGSAFSTYWNANALYQASKVTVATDGDQQSFKPRVPYDVAKGTSSANLGDNTGDVTGTVKSIPGTGQYTTSVIRRGWLKGYEATQTLTLPEYGQPNIAKDVKFCKFNESKAPYRLGGGWWTNNLDYRILNAAGGWTTWFDKADVTVACNDKGQPVLYAPIYKSKVGFLTAYDVPAGVVVYNGATGDIEYHKDMTSVNGVSLYPSSLAAKQRESAQTANGFMDWMFFSKAGWEDTSKDENDVNRENPTEFGMATDKGTIQFVTPLTPRGESKSIVAISTVNAGDNKYGQLAQLQVHKYETARQATPTVRSNVMAQGLGGQKTNLDVFEVVPGENGYWVATVGQSQTVVYRAYIAADDSMMLKDGSGKVVYSSKRDVQGATGQDKGQADAGKVDAKAPASGRDLSSMSVDELQKLSNDVSAELAGRAKANKDAK